MFDIRKSSRKLLLLALTIGLLQLSPLLFSSYGADILDEISYAQLKRGKITIQGKDVPTASLSSYPRAVEIANNLKGWILSGKFLLTEPVAPLPGVESGITFKPLKERPIKD